MANSNLQQNYKMDS